MTRATFLAEA